ncbi:MAG: hypothetical protein KC418_22100, partial [Anaerolineales bacterium]|nr:hypothetical protein [Anaerolineales bacterium]
MRLVRPHFCAKIIVWLLAAGLTQLLVGCRVAVAEMPTPAALVPTLAVAAANGQLYLPPPTWTPDPEATITPGVARQASSSNMPVSVRTPRPTVVLPTNTPIPPTPTRTPTPLPATPTGTPYAFSFLRLPPTDELGPSKLGLHVVRNNDPNIMAFVRAAQPAVMKAVDDVGFLEEVKAVSPRTLTIGRLNVAHQDYAGTPEQAARDFVNAQLATYLQNPFVDYWEGWNEPDPNMDHMIWYSRFEQERVRLLAEHGLKAAIGGFATGVPEFDEFQLFLPAIDVALQHQGILSLHEYGAPDMTYLYGGALPGMDVYPDRGALTFRYRWYYRDILEPAGMVIPLAITEAGIDGIISNRPGPPGFGWRDFGGYWAQQGWGDDAAQAFINQLAWYDAG